MRVFRGFSIILAAVILFASCGGKVKTPTLRSFPPPPQVPSVVTDPQANYTLVHVKLKGLDPDAMYSVGGEFECRGSTLMQNGYTFPQLTGDYPAQQLDIKRI